MNHNNYLRHLVKRTCVLQLTLLVVSLTAYAQSTEHRIDSLMKAKYHGGEFNGTVLVAVGGEIQYREAFGVAKMGVPLNVDTRFYLGSLSKAFTGMAIMILAESNQLSYDDKVINYFPELPEFMGEISIRNLLNHTSGLPDYYNLGKYVDGMTNGRVFEVILNLKSLEFPPGQQNSYSNTGYVLLSLLIERVSMNSYREFVRKQIFEPVGMKHSEIVDGTQPEMNDKARGHTSSGEDDDYKALTTGAGGIYSQVDDLFLWDQSLYSGNLVKKETLEAAYEPAILNDGTLSYYGFGWMLDKENPLIVQHSGSLAGFRTYLYRDLKNRNTVILLSNFTNDVSAIKEQIVRITGEH